MTSTIEWLDGGDTWNPTLGCSPAGEGCRNCYAARQAGRGLRPEWRGLTHKVTDSRTDKSRDVFNGTVRLMEDRLEAPLHWRKPRRVFVDSMSDLFHEKVPDAFIDRVFAVMARCQEGFVKYNAGCKDEDHLDCRCVDGPLRGQGHQFIILTKRAERMQRYLSDPETPGRIQEASKHSGEWHWETVVGEAFGMPWPLPNVVLGVSVSTQAEADALVPWLLKTPAAYRIVSAEPLLGAVDFTAIKQTISPGFFGDCLQWYHRGACHEDENLSYPKLNAVIVGGESGPGARPMHPDWARAIRDQCVAAGVAFFFKQWGEWVECEIEPISERPWLLAHPKDGSVLPEGRGFELQSAHETEFVRVGKRRAGRLLDGRMWDEWVGTPSPERSRC